MCVRQIKVDLSMHCGDNVKHSKVASLLFYSYNFDLDWKKYIVTIGSKCNEFCKKKSWTSMNVVFRMEQTLQIDIFVESNLGLNVELNVELDVELIVGLDVESNVALDCELQGWQQIILFLLLGATIYSVLFFSQSAIVLLVMYLFLGMMNASTRILRTTTLFQLVPNKIIGRTNSFFGVLLLTDLPLWRVALCDTCDSVTVWHIALRVT